jgi:uncharacterized protein YndB with AHSA1/START domain
MDKSAATQLYRIVINASAQAIWDAITLPEWTEKYGYGGRVEYELKAGGRYSHRASAEMKAMGMPDEIVVGQVIESDPPRKLVQTWHPLFDAASSAEPHTRLTYEIDAGQGGVCTVTMIHDVLVRRSSSAWCLMAATPRKVAAVGHGCSAISSRCWRPASGCRSNPAPSEQLTMISIVVLRQHHLRKMTT